MNEPYLSVIIPCFNEENRLGSTLERIVDYLRAREYASEVIVAPYAASPVMKVYPAAGVLWYLKMLLGPKMDGEYGSTESTTIDGRKIAPLGTQDGKLTTVVASAVVMAEETSTVAR